MGTTGLIFGAIALAWLAYLVPLWVRRSNAGVRPEINLDERFSDSVRVVGESRAEVEDGPAHELSTPLTRRAELTELKRRDQRAAGRRRLFLLVIMVALAAVSGVAIAGLVPVWAIAIPAALLPVFVVASRLSVRVMDRQRAEVLTALRGRDADTEDTVVITAGDPRTVEGGASKVTDVELGAPKPEGAAGLWDVVPVTAPTYVQVPTPPRTVRTIDLSAPPTPKPVTADPRSAASAAELPQSLGAEEQRPRAVGE